jgi:hypothetical protein
MRFAGLLALAGMLSACALVDPEQAAPRVAAGTVLGATLGAGLGATVAIALPVGAAIGAATGAALGAATGLATTPPAPSYAPITPSAAPLIPGYYDNWPPGWHLPPGNPAAPPARAG